MLTDPISDLLTRVRNGSLARHRKVDVPPSGLKLSILDLWKKEGFIRNYRMYRQGEKGVLRVYLKYVGKEPIIHGIKRVSRPSLRVYSRAGHIPKVLGGLGMSVLSTSKGVLSDRIAREQKVGGEVICHIW